MKKDNTSKKCKGRIKTCRKCKRRFTKKDVGYSCPDCGETRKCDRYATSGYDVCQVHGIGSVAKGRKAGAVPKLMKRNLNLSPPTKSDLIARKNPTFGAAIKEAMLNPDLTDLTTEMGIHNVLLANSFNNYDIGTIKFVTECISDALSVISQAKDMSAKGDEEARDRAVALANSAIKAHKILDKALSPAKKQTAVEKAIIEQMDKSSQLAERHARMEINKKLLFQASEMLAMVDFFYSIAENDLLPRIPDDKARLDAARLFRLRMQGIGFDKYKGDDIFIEGESEEVQ